MKADCRAFASALVTMIALLPTARANDVPKNFPRVDLRDAASAFVVARVSGGATLPPLDECTKDNVVCLHEPFWFHADVRETLVGDAVPVDTNVSTLSHYGLQSFLRRSPWRLLILKSVGDQVVMPINRWMPLVERSDGELFLIDDGGDWPSFLPCGMPGLLEPLGDAAFMPDPAVARDGQSHEFSFDVTEHPQAWRIEGDRALPRAGVRVTRLRTLLRELAARHEPTDCRRPD